MRSRRGGAASFAAAAAAFLLLLYAMPAFAPLFARAFPDVRPPIYRFQSFPMLFLSHAEIVAASSLAATAAALALGIFVTRPAGREFRALLGALAAIGQSVPPVAVLAIAVPVLGYGARPTFVALTLYGFLPILANVIAGIEGVPAAVREAAQGMGLSPFQVLRQVELPLAAPVILAGIRISVVISIGTATIGSTVGAVTLGTPIIDGLVSDKLPYVIEGAAVVAFFAVLADMAFERIGRRLRAYAENAA
ncbi:MAG TPA: ABC transporter permease [Stellaceae bacterium]|nr:ABC transporter permease [Stellaceae bacterium]